MEGEASPGRAGWFTGIKFEHHYKIGKFLSLDSDVELNLKIEVAKTRVGQGDIANIAIKNHLMNLFYEFE